MEGSFKKFPGSRLRERRRHRSLLVLWWCGPNSLRLLRRISFRVSSKGYCNRFDRLGRLGTCVCYHKHASEEVPHMYLLTTVVTFSALYLVSVVFVEFLLRTP